MFFSKQQVLCFVLILMLLGGMFGTQVVHSAHAAPDTSGDSSSLQHAIIELGAGYDTSRKNRTDSALSPPNVRDGFALSNNLAANGAPAKPVVVQPANGATNRPISLPLAVQVTDPDANPLNVTFYGRPAGTGSGSDFSLIVLPDTQYYSATYPQIFTSQTQWIADHKTSSNIAFVTHVGDIVDHYYSTTEYGRADTSMDILDAANVPYSVGPGNHDIPLDNFNTYFGVSRFAGKSYYGGHYGEGNENNYSLFSASGMDFILINLEFDPATDVLDWADALLKTYSTRRAIVSSHDILNYDDSWSYQDIYTALEDNPNLFLMLCGHTHYPTDGAAMRVETGENGNTVYILQSDYQDYPSGGNGYLRIMRFSPADDQIHVQTYSPYRSAYLTDADNEFDLPYSMAGYDLLGTVNGVASGGTATLLWPDLDINQPYEWYAVASDGALQTTSDTWTFTTGSSAPACYPLTLSHAGQGSNPTASPVKSAACSTNGQYINGTAITLSGAVASTGWQIGGWTGTANDGSTASSNLLLMPASAITVSVNYTQAEYTLAITSAHGTVTKNPNQATYNYGDIVQLTATADTGWSFANWTGDTTGTSTTASITIIGNKTVTANYTQNCYLLTLSHTGQGSNPTASPAKSTACSTNGQYVYGAAITLSGAVPSTGWQIGGWAGTASNGSTAATNSLTMPANASTASVNYTQIGYVLTITSPYGTVTKTLDKSIYGHGDIVHLTAKAISGWMFDSWSGDVSGTANPISVTMESNKSITANYVRSGADTTGVFRPSNGALYLKNSNTTGYADVQINYGIGGDYPIVGDWDGNGTATIGIYRNGSFYLRNENTIGFADIVFPFGMPGDQPVAGDWDGDGIDTIGVYRNGTFFLRNSNSGGAPEMIFALGIPGDVGIAGDWDGDGKDTTGVFRPSNGALYLKNKNETGYADIQINYGIAGDKPVTGDWNNDGIDTIGVYRNGQFMLRNSNTIGYAEIVFALGIQGDMPIAGNWNGIP